MTTITRARSATDLSVCNALQYEVFANGEHRDVHKDHWWLVRVDGVPAGFACLRLYPDNTAYQALSGVVPRFRGRQIQRRLLKVREQFAKARGCTVVVTYTAWRNWPSANNLIREGYTLYTPKKTWGLAWSLYFRKDLA